MKNYKIQVIQDAVTVEHGGGRMTRAPPPKKKNPKILKF